MWPVLRNRADEMGTGSALRWSVRHRLSIVADAAGIDVEEARAWSLLRAGIQGSWATVSPDPDDVSTCISVAKALDD